MSQGRRHFLAAGAVALMAAILFPNWANSEPGGRFQTVLLHLAIGALIGAFIAAEAKSQGRLAFAALMGALIITGGSIVQAIWYGWIEMSEWIWSEGPEVLVYFSFTWFFRLVGYYAILFACAVATRTRRYGRRNWLLLLLQPFGCACLEWMVLQIPANL